MQTHDFLLLPEPGGDYSDYARFINDPRAIHLADDLVRYIADTLEWVPSHNPSNPAEWRGHGLNYYGPTVIDRAGAPLLGRVMWHWAALWAEGPERLELTGGYEWFEGESPDTGRYRKFVVERDSAVRAFRTIAEYAERAASGEFYVLHLGI